MFGKFCNVYSDQSNQAANGHTRIFYDFNFIRIATEDERKQFVLHAQKIFCQHTLQEINKINRKLTHSITIDSEQYEIQIPHNVRNHILPKGMSYNHVFLIYKAHQSSAPSHNKGDYGLFIPGAIVMQCLDGEIIPGKWGMKRIKVGVPKDKHQLEIKRIQQEWKYTRTRIHPFWKTVHQDDASVVKGFIPMRQYDNDLKSYLQKYGNKLSFRGVLEIFSKAAMAYIEFHNAHNVAHMDVKLSNLCVEYENTPAQGGVPKIQLIHLINFGKVQRFDFPFMPVSRNYGLFQLNRLLIAWKRPVDRSLIDRQPPTVSAKDDVFSFGYMLYEALAVITNQSKWFYELIGGYIGRHVAKISDVGLKDWNVIDVIKYTLDLELSEKLVSPYIQEFVTEKEGKELARRFFKYISGALAPTGLNPNRRSSMREVYMTIDFTIFQWLSPNSFRLTNVSPQYFITMEQQKVQGKVLAFNRRFLITECFNLNTAPSVNFIGSRRPNDNASNRNILITDRRTNRHRWLRNFDKQTKTKFCFTPWHIFGAAVKLEDKNLKVTIFTIPTGLRGIKTISQSKSFTQYGENENDDVIDLSEFTIEGYKFAYRHNAESYQLVCYITLIKNDTRVKVVHILLLDNGRWSMQQFHLDAGIEIRKVDFLSGAKKDRVYVLCSNTAIYYHHFTLIYERTRFYINFESFLHGMAPHVSSHPSRDLVAFLTKDDMGMPNIQICFASKRIVRCKCISPAVEMHMCHVAFSANGTKVVVYWERGLFYYSIDGLDTLVIQKPTMKMLAQWQCKQSQQIKKININDNGNILVLLEDAPTVSVEEEDENEGEGPVPEPRQKPRTQYFIKLQQSEKVPSQTALVHE